LAFAAFSLSMQ